MAILRCAGLPGGLRSRGDTRLCQALPPHAAASVSNTQGVPSQQQLPRAGKRLQVRHTNIAGLCVSLPPRVADLPSHCPVQHPPRHTSSTFTRHQTPGTAVSRGLTEFLLSVIISSFFPLAADQSSVITGGFPLGRRGRRVGVVSASSTPCHTSPIPRAPTAKGRAPGRPILGLASQPTRDQGQLESTTRRPTAATGSEIHSTKL